MLFVICLWLSRAPVEFLSLSRSAESRQWIVIVRQSSIGQSELVSTSTTMQLLTTCLSALSAAAWRLAAAGHCPHCRIVPIPPERSRTFTKFGLIAATPQRRNAATPPRHNDRPRTLTCPDSSPYPMVVVFFQLTTTILYLWFVAPLPHRCPTAAPPLPHRCPTAAPPLPHRCPTAAALLHRCVVSWNAEFRSNASGNTEWWLCIFSLHSFTQAFWINACIFAI